LADPCNPTAAVLRLVVRTPNLKEEIDVRILRGNSNRYQVRLLAVALLAVLGFVAAGCGGSSSPSALQSGVAGAQHSISSKAVMTRKIKGLGTVLVNAKGRTLYVFMKDAHRHVTCTGQCASFWPPLKWKGSGKPTAGGSAKSSLLAWDKDPAGGKVVTYNKWPLYTYSGDSAAGQAKGWNLDLSGGKWFVISPSGKVVKHKTKSGGNGGGTTTSKGGWG
jgi:predicted lipoprotein with Yx(FWY)xxD motif